MTGDDLVASSIPRPTSHREYARPSRVLAIRTSALGGVSRGGLARRGSSPGEQFVGRECGEVSCRARASSSQRSKCGLQMTRRWRFSRRSRIASDAAMPRSMRASATTVAERLSPTWQWTRMVCPRSRRRLTSCARSPNCFATSSVTSPSSTVTFTHSIPFRSYRAHAVTRFTMKSNPSGARGSGAPPNHRPGSTSVSTGTST